jgi:hypothetical protein
MLACGGIYVSFEEEAKLYPLDERPFLEFKNKEDSQREQIIPALTKTYLISAFGECRNANSEAGISLEIGSYNPRLPCCFYSALTLSPNLLLHALWLPWTCSSLIIHASDPQFSSANH